MSFLENLPNVASAQAQVCQKWQMGRMPSFINLPRQPSELGLELGLDRGFDRGPRA